MKQKYEDINNKILINDYDTAKKLINGLKEYHDDVLLKITELEICYSNIAIIGGLLHEDYMTQSEFDNCKRRINKDLIKKKNDFKMFLERISH